MSTNARIYFCMINDKKLRDAFFIWKISLMCPESTQYLACDIWTTLSALAYFGESTTPSQHTSLRMNSASIKITSKINSEQDGISLFKFGHMNHWLELRKVDSGREQLLPLSLLQIRGGGGYVIM